MGIIISTLVSAIILRAIYASIKRSEYRQMVLNDKYQAYLYAKDKNLPPDLYKNLIQDPKLKVGETRLSLKQQQLYFSIPEVKEIDLSKYNPVNVIKKRTQRKPKATTT